MPQSVRFIVSLLVAITASVALVGGVIAQNSSPNPYLVDEGWASELPGREWGSTSAVFPARDGSGNIWVAERCGQNSCVGQDHLDSVFLFDPDGNILTSWGAGLIVWPHGIFVDHDDNVWIADARGDGARGHQVHKFTPEGQLLMSLGTAGVAGKGQNVFDQPNDVLVSPNGSVFVADGHPRDGNNRIVKFEGDGTYTKEWGETGSNPGQFRTPHALAMDSQGLLYVGDRSNRRIQIFDQEGNFIKDWFQFGRASGVFIDQHDMIYVADSESNSRSNEGYSRGIRIASVTDGRIIAFISDPEPDPDNAGTTAAEGVAVDAMGNIYGAEVGPRQVVRYVKR